MSLHDEATYDWNGHEKAKKYTIRSYPSQDEVMYDSNELQSQPLSRLEVHFSCLFAIDVKDSPWVRTRRSLSNDLLL